MVGTIIFWATYIISAISLYLQFRCTYVSDWSYDVEDYEKQKYPILVYLLLIILWFVPIANIISTLILWIILVIWHEGKVSVHNFLFKQV